MVITLNIDKEELKILIKEVIEEERKKDSSLQLSGELTKEEIYNSLFMQVDTNIKLSSVILSNVNKDKIRQFVLELNNRDRLAKFDLKPMNRLLFYGDSGCGKTFLGKALSNHLNYKMLYVDIARALSQGNVAMNISNVFEIAHSGPNYEIFLDECDSIAWNRDAKNAEGGEIRRATNSLFQHMDQMRSDTIVICATNMLHRLDPAFERRFNMKLEFKRPEEQVKEIIKKFLKPKFELIEDKQDPITERRAKMSYYELEDVANRVMKQAVLNNTTKIKMSDVYIDVARQMNVKTVLNVDMG